MKNCGNKVKHTCGTTNYSTCIHWEGDVNPQSEYTTEDCLSLEETTQDQYNQLENIWNEIDLSELGENCLEYLLDENDKIVVKNVLLKFEEEICNLKEELELVKNRQVCDIPITECLPDLGCLALPCDTSITTLGDWMLAVQTKICETP